MLDSATATAIQESNVTLHQAQRLLDQQCFSAAHDLCLTSPLLASSAGVHTSAAVEATRLPLMRILFLAMLRLHSTAQDLIRVAEQIIALKSCDASDFERLAHLHFRVGNISAARVAFSKAFSLSDLTTHLQGVQDCLHRLLGMRTTEAECRGLLIRPIPRDGMCLLRSIDSWYDAAHVIRPYTNRLAGLISRVCDVAGRYRTNDITPEAWEKQVDDFRYHRNYRCEFCDEPIIRCLTEVLGYEPQICHVDSPLPTTLDMDRPASLRSGEHFDTLCDQRGLQAFLRHDEDQRTAILSCAVVDVAGILATSPTSALVCGLMPRVAAVDRMSLIEYRISLDPWDFRARYDLIHLLLEIGDVTSATDAMDTLIRYRTKGTLTSEDQDVHNAVLTANNNLITQCVLLLSTRSTQTVWIVVLIVICAAL